MTKTSIFFEKAKAKKIGTGGLYIAINKKGKRALIGPSIKLKPEQWNGTSIVNHPYRDKLNLKILKKLNEIRNEIEKAEAEDKFIDMTATEIADAIQEKLDPEAKRRKESQKDKKKQFLTWYGKFLETKTKPGTHSVYACTLRILKRFAESEGKGLDTLPIDEFDRTWLQRLEAYCLRTEKRTTLNIHLRNIRAAFNAAIDDGLCTTYPFRKYKLHRTESKDKSITLEELKELFAAPCNNDGERFAIDMFKLELCLIGINNGDLYKAPKPIKGRLIYERAKTGRRYSIKIEPEAAEIIRKYEGANSLLNLKEQFKNYKTLFHRAAVSLKKTGLVCVSGKKSKGKALQPDICFGSARTSWATIAQQELDIPREVIAAALGHHTVDVTDTYLRTAWQNKVDKANRQVLDLVFGTNCAKESKNNK